MTNDIEKLKARIARLDRAMNDPELSEDEYEELLSLYADACWQLKDLEEGVRFMD